MSDGDRSIESVLEQALGHSFKESELLETALTHSSAAHEQDGSRGNERLEFLGDAVLDLVVGRLLYERNPDWEEGRLTRARAALVNKDSLARIARGLDLGTVVRLGRTERQSNGHEKDSVLANCFEAVVGALYLDAGIEPVFDLADRIFGPVWDDEAVSARDPKTAFQEWAHAHLSATPTYSLLDDNMLDDAADRFHVDISVGGEIWGDARGRSKRTAERAAAVVALARTKEHT
jgi:ribonuclease-3